MSQIRDSIFSAQIDNVKILVGADHTDIFTTGALRIEEIQSKYPDANAQIANGFNIPDLTIKIESVRKGELYDADQKFGFAAIVQKIKSAFKGSSVQGDHLEGLQDIAINDIASKDSMQLIFVLAHGEGTPLKILLKTNFNFVDPLSETMPIGVLCEQLSKLNGKVCLFLTSCYAHNGFEEFKQLPKNIVVITLDKIGEKVNSEKHLPCFLDALEKPSCSHNLFELIKAIGNNDGVGSIFHDGEELSFQDILTSALGDSQDY